MQHSSLHRVRLQVVYLQADIYLQRVGYSPASVKAAIKAVGSISNSLGAHTEQDDTSGITVQLRRAGACPDQGGAALRTW